MWAWVIPLGWMNGEEWELSQNEWTKCSHESRLSLVKWVWAFSNKMSKKWHVETCCVMGINVITCRARNWTGYTCYHRVATASYSAAFSRPMMLFLDHIPCATSLHHLVNEVFCISHDMCSPALCTRARITCDWLPTRRRVNREIGKWWRHANSKYS